MFSNDTISKSHVTTTISLALPTFRQRKWKVKSPDSFSHLTSGHDPHRKKSLACETKLSVKVLSHQNAISLGQPNSTHSFLEVKLKRLQLLQ